MDVEKTQSCIIVGASHAGVNAAFALRKHGWNGEIVLIDKDPELPYHRPPLSKKYLTDDAEIEKYALKPLRSYENAAIKLELGKKVLRISPEEKNVILEGEQKYAYDKLILATGGEAFIPPIEGIDEVQELYTIRHAVDVERIKKSFQKNEPQKVAIIGGGFIGLEIAASLRKMGVEVLLFERENRILSRVTSPELSDWFQRLHEHHRVRIFINKELKEVKVRDGVGVLDCMDGSTFEAGIIIVGVGIRVWKDLAENAGLKVGNGIEVNSFMQSSDEHIYAIGDCSYHNNEAYEGKMRLESVQNAVEQAKIAAAHICGQEIPFVNIPWFWSDQFDAKLQMVGLMNGADRTIFRMENNKKGLSVWFFRGEELIAVHAVNHPRAYVLGTKFIKEARNINQDNLANPKIELNPENLLLQIGLK